jgi:hypothetical protein
MAESLVVTVSETVVESKVSQNNGKAYKQMTVRDEQGNIFSGFVNQGTLIPKQGDVVKIDYQPVQLKTGPRYNILEIKPATGESTTNKTLPPSAPAPGKSTFTSKNTQVNTDVIKTSQFNNKGARVGGILHDAVAIAIHNAQIGKCLVDLEAVESLAETLLDLASRLEG